MSLLHRLPALLLAAVLLFPTGLALQLSAVDTCSCGMKSGSCFCKMMSGRRGAHCDMRKRGSCGMRAPVRSDRATLPVTLDLRGWLRALPSAEMQPDREPSGTVFPLECSLGPAPAASPETPPPELFQAA
jgi:hypothetical protein